MKSNTRLIRLVIYLVVSIALIILLWNFRKSGNSKKQIIRSNEKITDGARYAIENDKSLNKYYFLNNFVDSMTYYQYFMPPKIGLPVDAPTDLENYEFPPQINISIDSNNIYYLNDTKIEWNELVDSITVQQEREPKLSILLCVDKKAKAGYVAKVLEIVKEKNMKVGISTKID